MKRLGVSKKSGMKKLGVNKKIRREAQCQHENARQTCRQHLTFSVQTELMDFNHIFRELRS